jgi:3-oxoadipate enol-lactonase
MDSGTFLTPIVAEEVRMPESSPGSDRPMTRSRSFAVNGVELNFRVDGERDAPALVLLNGAMTNLHFFTHLMPDLVDRYCVVRHDWRGTGLSSGGERVDYTFPQYADDLAALLDHLGIARAAVMGMAYGGRVAARFALLHPDRVDALALYDVSLDQPVDQVLQKQGNAEAKRLREVEGLPEPRVERAWFEHRDKREAGRSTTAHFKQPDPTPELAQVEVPALVVCGRQDVNLPEAERIAAVLPDAELHVMEMTGHASVLSRPDVVSALLLDFLDRRLPAA